MEIPPNCTNVGYSLGGDSSPRLPVAYLAATASGGSANMDTNIARVHLAWIISMNINYKTRIFHDSFHIISRCNIPTSPWIAQHFCACVTPWQSSNVANVPTTAGAADSTDATAMLAVTMTMTTWHWWWQQRLLSRFYRLLKHELLFSRSLLSLQEL